MNNDSCRPPFGILFTLSVSFVLLFGACTSAVEPTRTPTVAPTATRTEIFSPMPPTEPVSNPETPATCPPLDAQMRATMRQLEGQVTRLRGLPASGVVERDLLTPEQLRERVENDFLADYTEEEARLDNRLLALLGLIEPELDLHRLYVDLLTEQVAGFYDSQEEEMLVVCGTGFGGLEIFTYVHEYVHALQDQTFDLEAGLNFSEEACELDGERCFALRALIEGDASLLQEQWLRTYADREMLASLLSSLSSFDSPVLESAPEYIQAELTFPYLAGLSFTRSLYLEGDWAAVDSAFQNPPLSSEQILHPERYPRDEPVALSPPPDLDSLADGWGVERQDVLGEWATQQVLLSYLSEDAVQKSVGGWGGDLIFLLERSANDPAALVLITQWDTVRDTHEFAAEFMNYAEARFGQPAHRDLVEATWVFDGGASHFMRQSNQTRWIIAPDGETLSMLQAEFALPLASAP
jgi:hypothetical protein